MKKRVRAIVKRSLVAFIMLAALGVFWISRTSSQPVVATIRQIPEMGLVYLGTAVQNVKNAVSNGSEAMTRAREQQAELQKLREENIKLQMQLESLKSEMERNTTTQAAQEKMPSITGQIAVTAPIIFRSPSRWMKQAILPVGRAQGIQLRSAAIAPDGIVGIVTEVEAAYSVLQFVTGAGAVVGGKIERTGETVILEGAGSTGVIKFLPLRSDVHAGDALLTSGQDGIFPEGLKVGTVTRTTENLGRATLEAEFVPSVAFEKLKWVVLLEPRRVPTLR